MTEEKWAIAAEVTSMPWGWPQSLCVVHLVRQVVSCGLQAVLAQTPLSVCHKEATFLNGLKIGTHAAFWLALFFLWLTQWFSRVLTEMPTRAQAQFRGLLALSPLPCQCKSIPLAEIELSCILLSGQFITWDKPPLLNVAYYICVCICMRVSHDNLWCIGRVGRYCRQAPGNQRERVVGV